MSLVALLLVVAQGAVLDVMDVDASQYASMARDMLSFDHRPDNATWLQLYYRGNDHLDKPPLLFWLSALSFKLFGVANWSYKLPSILFAFLGMYSTYRFAKLYHSDVVARTAGLMFGGSVAFLLMTNDVRTDTILTGSVITAIWLGSAYIEQRRWWQLVGFTIALASGMLAKGPMGLMAPALALAGQVVLAKRWDVLRDPRWLLVLPMLALFLAPMCFGLYQQHGTHGLRFYFWEQSFGRITGENRWKDDSTFLFFSHELLWQLLPWTIFLLAGVGKALKELVQRKASPEYTSIAGVLLVFTAISLSQFKLPHYLYVILPLFAVLAARSWHAGQPSWMIPLHWGVLSLIWAGAMALVLWVFPEGGLPYALMLVILAAFAVRSMYRAGGANAAFSISFLLFMAAGTVLNGHFYPNLLRFQGNAQAGRWAFDHGLDIDHFFGMQVSGSSLDHYAGYPVRWLSDVEEAATVIAPGVTIYTDQERMEELVAAGLIPKETIQLLDYNVQLLSAEMLLPQQREKVLRKRYLLRY